MRKSDSILSHMRENRICIPSVLRADLSIVCGEHECRPLTPVMAPPTPARSLRGQPVPEPLEMRYERKLLPPGPDTDTHTHTHTSSHTCSHTLTDTHTLAHIQGHTLLQTHRHTHIHSHTQIGTVLSFACG